MNAKAEKSVGASKGHPSVAGRSPSPARDTTRTPTSTANAQDGDYEEGSSDASSESSPVFSAKPTCPSETTQQSKADNGGAKIDTNATVPADVFPLSIYDSRREPNDDTGKDGLAQELKDMSCNNDSSALREQSHGPLSSAERDGVEAADAVSRAERAKLSHGNQDRPGHNDPDNNDPDNNDPDNNDPDNNDPDNNDPDNNDPNNNDPDNNDPDNNEHDPMNPFLVILELWNNPIMQILTIGVLIVAVVAGKYAKINTEISRINAEVSSWNAWKTFVDFCRAEANRSSTPECTLAMNVALPAPPYFNKFTHSMGIREAPPIGAIVLLGALHIMILFE